MASHYGTSSSSSVSPSTTTSLKPCSLKSCLKGPGMTIDQDGARVEVRAFEPKSTKKMVVNWGDRGEAQFHKDCWKVLIQATRGRNTSDTIDLIDLERSMVLEAEKSAEHHDSCFKKKREAVRIAHILKNSSHSIAFTGAGISTAAGIGDFRGKDGKWTDREKVKNYGKAAKATSGGVVTEQLRPTYTHEALVKLIEMDILKYVISQNTDGLHRLSGVKADQISELHGNSFIERCEDCPARYQRNFPCRKSSDKVPPLKCPKCKINHRTGRTCSREACKGFLMNTIINFGDYLESDVLSLAEHHASHADAVLVLGSTLRVSPANRLVLQGRAHGPHKLIICNRQSTPYDEDCEEYGQGSRVFGDCDDVMREVMKELLPPDELQRWEAARPKRLIEYGLKRSSVR